LISPASTCKREALSVLNELNALPVRFPYMERRPQHRQELEGIHPGIVLGAPLVIIALFMAIMRALT
jgi:hypothetical protein